MHYAPYSAIKRNCRCLLSANQIKLLVPPHKLRGDSDPTVTVALLEEAISTFMSEAVEHRDLQQVFRVMEMAGGWNTAPSKFVAAIAKLKRFYKLMFSVCRNGLIPIKMLEEALKNLENYQDKQGARIYHWNFLGRPIAQAASNLGLVMRTGASKLRDLAADPKLMQISLVGQSSETCECIREICEKLTITPKARDTPSDSGRRDTESESGRPPLKREAGVVVPKQEPGMDPDEFDYSMPDIFDMAFRGDFGKAALVRRPSSQASTATSSQSLNPLDGLPGRPAPPSVPSPALSPITSIAWPAKDLQIVPFVNPFCANLARKLSFDLGADTTPMSNRHMQKAGDSDLPSGAKLTKSDLASPDGKHLFVFDRIGPAMAETLGSMESVKAMKHVKPGRRTKPKKAGGPVKPFKPSTRTKGAASPYFSGKYPRHNHCCRAYRKALRKAKRDGKPEVQRRLDAQAAYKKAGSEFDNMRS